MENLERIFAIKERHSDPLVEEVLVQLRRCVQTIPGFEVPDVSIIEKVAQDYNAHKERITQLSRTIAPINCLTPPKK